METEADMIRLERLVRKFAGPCGQDAGLLVLNHRYDSRGKICRPNLVRAKAVKYLSSLEGIPKHPAFKAEILLSGVVDVVHRIQIVKTERVFICAGTRQQSARSPLVICEVT